MAGDISNPRLWEGADFYVAPVGTPMPESLTGDLSELAGWDPLGLLSEDGASESRDEDSNEFYAWGGILIRTSRSKHKRTLTVTALEDNLAVFGLVNPGSSVSTSNGVNTRTVRVPRSDKRAFLLELRDGDTVRRRYIPQGEITSVGDITMSESDLQAFELTVTIYPSADGVLYYDLDNDPQGAVSTGGGGTGDESGSE